MAAISEVIEQRWSDTALDLHSSRNDTLMVNSDPLDSRLSRIVLTDLGTIPASSSLLMLPSIVWVFPVPVCPYAKIVQLNPSSTSQTMGRTILSNTSSCLEYMPNTLSKVKLLMVFLPAGPYDSWTALASGSQVTTDGWPDFLSSTFTGLQRTATCTFVPFAALLLLLVSFMLVTVQCNFSYAT